jgi:hypothetical protein
MAEPNEPRSPSRGKCEGEYTKNKQSRETERELTQNGKASLWRRCCFRYFPRRMALRLCASRNRPITAGKTASALVSFRS